MTKKHDARRGIAINGSRHRVKKKNGHALDAALAAVREGQMPQVDPNSDYGIIMVEDPYDPKRPDGLRIMRPKIAALRDDPIGRMFNRGQLEHASDDGHAAKVRFDAARRWQAVYDRAEVGGARAIDFTREVVDGCMLKTPDTAGLHEAQQQLLEFDCQLGEEGASLVRAVLGERCELKDVALQLGVQTDFEKRYLGYRLTECLDTLARQMGLMAQRPASGPRRERDEWDRIARYADQPPELMKAVLRARER